MKAETQQAATISSPEWCCLLLQLRQLHVEVLRGRLENQERRSKDRFMRLEWARGAAQLRVDWLSQERDELRTRNGDLVRDRKAARVQVRKDL